MGTKNIKLVTFEEFRKGGSFTRKQARDAINLALKNGFATINNTTEPTTYEIRYDVEYGVVIKNHKISKVYTVREMPERKRRVSKIGNLKGLLDNYTIDEIWKHFSMEELARIIPVFDEDKFTKGKV